MESKDRDDLLSWCFGAWGLAMDGRELRNITEKGLLSIGVGRGVLLLKGREKRFRKEV